MATDNYFLEFYNGCSILVYKVQTEQCKQSSHAGIFQNVVKYFVSHHPCKGNHKFIPYVLSISSLNEL